MNNFYFQVSAIKQCKLSSFRVLGKCTVLVCTGFSSLTGEKSKQIWFHHQCQYIVLAWTIWRKKGHLLRYLLVNFYCCNWICIWPHLIQWGFWPRFCSWLCVYISSCINANFDLKDTLVCLNSLQDGDNVTCQHEKCPLITRLKILLKTLNITDSTDLSKYFVAIN